MRTVVVTHHRSHLTNIATVSGANLYYTAFLCAAKLVILGRIFRRPGGSPTPP
jgi:hypothetical protein